MRLANILTAENAKVIIVACNTVSSVAIPKLRGACQSAGHRRDRARRASGHSITRNRHIGVIGTRATIRSGAYENALRALKIHVRVTSRACPLLVPLIEEGLLNDSLTDRKIARYLGPMMTDGIDTLVLGCTHYPLLAAQSGVALGEEIKLVDSAQNCATAVRNILHRQSKSDIVVGAEICASH